MQENKIKKPPTMMQIIKTDMGDCCTESEVWSRLLSLDGAAILELGCGTAELTRMIATANDCSITAMEVDAIQHSLNMQINDLPNVDFMLGAAEAIPCKAASFDIVMMFKSLHHVPEASMNQALEEIHRVLKPGGMAYISEPVFAGDFNNILRLFHDEEKVRKAAFQALKRAVDSGRFVLADEVFFLSPMHFTNFAEFSHKVIGVTHSNHQLSDAVYEQVKLAFNQKVGAAGANFEMPMRVDLLLKPA